MANNFAALKMLKLQELIECKNLMHKYKHMIFCIIGTLLCYREYKLLTRIELLWFIEGLTDQLEKIVRRVFYDNDGTISFVLQIL